MHIPIPRQWLGKQARNKYPSNNRVDPLLGNTGNTHTTIEEVLQEVFSAWVHTMPIAKQRLSKHIPVNTQQ
jgi:hypothetical protein